MPRRLKHKAPCLCCPQELWATFSGDVDVSPCWKQLTHALSGMFCASLNFLDNPLAATSRSAEDLIPSLPAVTRSLVSRIIATCAKVGKDQLGLL